MTDRPTTKLRMMSCAAALVAALSAGVCAAHAQSFTDRFKNFFGGGGSSDAPPPEPAPAEEGDLTCPTVEIRAGASTYAVGPPGKTAAGNDLRYQATLGRTARECSVGGGQITARIGIQGRVIAGPAGAPASVNVPLRVAVVQEGVSPKTIFTKAYSTTVSMAGDTSVPFTILAEGIVYPAPRGADGDAYVFYIGFDPQALRPEPRVRPKKK